MAHEVIMPKMGESIVEGTIIDWKKNIGDSIEKDEILLEISTDKVDSEIPSPFEGTLLKILFNKNDTVAVGAAIALIGDKGESLKEDSSDKSEKIEKEEKKEKVEKKTENKIVKTVPLEGRERKNKSKIFYSPLVKSIAEKEGIPLSELDLISGSGLNGRVNKNDVLEYIQTKGPSISKASHGESSLGQTKFGKIEEMDHVRKVIAKHMVDSVKKSPHVYSSVEVDMTNVVKFVQRSKDQFFKKYNNKLTYTPIFLEACVNAIQKYPLINSSLIENQIHYHKNINIGIAVALPDNNLIVPVIDKSDEKNFLGLLRSAADLADSARKGALSPKDVQGSTFTLTNPGIFGSLFGMGIINQPNVAILSTGSIEKKAMVKETEFGDAVFIRSSMYLTLGYDHRIIDGAYGSKFLVAIKECLEKFDLNRVF